MIKSIEVTKEHTEFRDEMVKVLEKFDHLPADVLLALASYLVGQLIALQDQRKYTPAAIMELVQNNLELGNKYALQEMFGKTEGEA